MKDSLDDRITRLKDRMSHLKDTLTSMRLDIVVYVNICIYVLFKFYLSH